MNGADETALERLLRRDRAVILVALVMVAALAWAYLFLLAAGPRMAPPAAGAMSNPPGMDMGGMKMAAPRLAPWTPAQFLLVLAMWSVMMIGMMMPAVSPMILLYARVARSAAAQGSAFAPAFWFALGYLLAWSLFSLVATSAQWALEQALLLTPMMALATPKIGGAFLIGAGIYQWLPIKASCLAHCRAPMQFVQSRGGFKPGAGHSVRLGLLHGLYCIGCCWALMALLFVGGVMNLIWIAGLAALVFLEQVAPQGRWISRIAGIGMGIAGAFLILQG